MGAWICTLGLLIPALSSCDHRGYGEIPAARVFAGAVVSNNVTLRNSMIATAKFKAEFDNPTADGGDMRQWFEAFYDPKQEGGFTGTATMDPNRNLKPDLQGALIDTTEIEETGTVKVKTKDNGHDAAIFWMVRQRGKPWRIAMVTKSETTVNFR